MREKLISSCLNDIVRLKRCLLLVGLILPLVGATVGPQSPTLIIRNATLIDGTGKPPIDQTAVFITGEHVSRVAAGAVPVPEGSQVIDAAGLTLIPGLIDMHIHSRPWAWPLFLKFGVTTVRDVGSDPDYIFGVSGGVPRIFACGPLLDGFPPYWGTQWRGSMGLRSPGEARAAAKSMLDRGASCLKVYARLPKALMEAIVEVASERGVPVTGHVGAVSARDAVEIGVQSIEHASGIRLPMPPGRQESLIQFLISKGTFIVPTLLVSYNLANLPTIGHSHYPNLDLVPPREARRWLDWKKDFRFRETTEGSFARRRRGAAVKAEFIGAFQRAGGKVVAGSDTPNPFVVPGVSLHQEMEHLVAAGLSTLDAIAAATSVAAALLRRPDLGVIAEGKLADLVLVAGDPARQISATWNIRMVIKGGAVVHEQR